jgi:uncharacterized membrane protein
MELPWSRKNHGMRFAVAIGSLVVLVFSVAAAGCSSSQETASAASAASTGTSGAVSLDPRVNAILETSCYSCHSTGGTAPWYAAISPSYLAAGAARDALNFSDWDSYDAKRKAAELRVIAETVNSGSMPPGDFTLFDRSARLTDDDKQAVLAWTSRVPTPIPAH